MAARRSPLNPAMVGGTARKRRSPPRCPPHPHPGEPRGRRRRARSEVPQGGGDRSRARGARCVASPAARWGRGAACPERAWPVPHCTCPQPPPGARRSSGDSESREARRRGRRSPPAARHAGGAPAPKTLSQHPVLLSVLNKIKIKYRKIIGPQARGTVRPRLGHASAPRRSRNENSTRCRRTVSPPPARHGGVPPEPARRARADTRGCAAVACAARGSLPAGGFRGCLWGEGMSRKRDYGSRDGVVRSPPERGRTFPRGQSAPWRLGTEGALARRGCAHHGWRPRARKPPSAPRTVQRAPLPSANTSPSVAPPAALLRKVPRSLCLRPGSPQSVQRRGPFPSLPTQGPAPRSNGTAPSRWLS